MNILLVDNSQEQLANLAAHFTQHHCQTARVNDALQALKLLKKYRFDALIVGEQVAKTTPEEFLKAIALKFPRLIRIARLKAEQPAINSLAHYVFTADDSDKLLVDKVLSFEHAHQVITKDVVVKSVTNVKTLPSPPKVYLQLSALLEQTNCDSDKIAEIISQDPALTAKVLQFTNNTFALTDKPLTNISDAITKMGIDVLTCIVMTAELFSYQPDIPNFSVIKEQLHSLATARFAASLVPQALKQETLLAGLLHDLGKLVLYEMDKKLTLTYLEHSKRQASDIALERRIFSTDHCQVGAYLLHTWSFPYQIIDAILHHHSPSRLLAEQLGTAQAVYLANCLLNNQPLDQDFIKHFKLTDQVSDLQNQALKYQTA